MSPSSKLASALIALAFGGATAQAAIVFFPNQDIPIPTNFAGVSVDLETGFVSNSIDGVGDGDANFFFGGAELSNDADAGVATPSWQPVRAAAGNTDIALNLPAGAVVDASGASGTSGSYSAGYGSSGDVTSHFPEFTPGSPGFIGFSMVPNAGGPVVYGWAEVTFQNDGVTPGIIHGWAYESTPGLGIVVGVPEPGTASLALLGLSAFILRRRR